jgi:hypothetical protein
MTDRAGKTRLVALVGGKFGDGARTVKDVSIASIAGSSQSGGSDGRMRSLNNNGELVFYVAFEEGGAAVYTGKFAEK